MKALFLPPTRNIQQSLEFIVCDVVGVDGAAGDSIYIFYTGVMTW